MLRKLLVFIFLFVPVVVFGQNPKISGVCSDSVLLFADDFKDLDFAKLPVYKLDDAPRGGYMLSIQSFDIDLKNGYMIISLDSIKDLPVFSSNRSLDFLLPPIVKIPLSGWATIAY